MQRFTLVFGSHFRKRFKEISKQNSQLENLIFDVLDTIASNPYSAGLKTHKARTRLFGLKRSSRVTGDLRIILDFGADIEIIILDIGGHDEVYK